IKEDGFIHIKQIKTNEPLMIPVFPIAQSILNKYGGNVPAAISNQKTNQYVKEIGSMIKTLHEVVPVTYEDEQGNKVTQDCKKYELISTNTARRSFATNLYLKPDVKALYIMSLTGHKTEKAFLRYIKFSQAD